MSLLFIGESETEQDLFQLGLRRIKSDIDFHPVTDCQSAVNLLNASVLRPDFIVLDTDVPGCEVDKCLSMIKDSMAIETSTIVAYSESMETTQIAFMLSHGAKSHLYKSRSFSIFCNDLVLLLDKKTAD